MNTKAIYDEYSVQSTRAVDMVPSLHGATDGSRPQDDGGKEELATRCCHSTPEGNLNQGLSGNRQQVSH